MVVAEELAGRECYGGLDLSATTDLTAFSVIFPTANHQALDVLSWFWIPEYGLDERMKRDQVPYREWSEAGFIHLTEGNVVDYDEVTKVIELVAETYGLRKVSHDRWQAGAVVQFLAKKGIETNPVPQTYQGMSAATKELERLVKQKAFHHGGHPVHRWNADSVEVLRDQNDNVRPVKPNRQKSIHRVDGITADVMAIDGWMRRPEQAAAPATSSAVKDDQPDIYARGRRSRLNI
jgi:phage terminase large subunit-like protein